MMVCASLSLDLLFLKLKTTAMLSIKKCRVFPTHLCGTGLVIMGMRMKLKTLPGMTGYVWL